MSIIADQKSQLAKLMATENIIIEHKKIQTAGFDPKNRVLYLPIWQDMNGVMYDLLCGHEVGHALYTPSDGWHNAVADESKGRGYKSFLNVVEDARIEKKIKRRYPGLNVSFKNAYAELLSKDFFGIRNRDINEMSFIDRLNIFSKSQYTITNINFSAQEEVYIRRVQELETWEDVVKLTDEIYEYVKNQEFETQKEYHVINEFNDDDFNDDNQNEFDHEYKDSDSSNEVDDETKLENEQPVKNVDDVKDEEPDDRVDGINRFKESRESFEDQFVNTTCETDDNYRQNEKLLLDEKCKDYLYVTLPKPILSNIITPAKRVHELLSKSFNNQIVYNKQFSVSDVTKWVNEFKTKNEKFVGLLAKEFEMRKAAKIFSKSKISNTGDIDINKLATYKIDDNIFRKVMTIPKGKNHGLILLLDKSGSMTNNMSGSIEQILVLTMFCRKVNIPFVVYGFGDAADVYAIEHSINFNSRELRDRECFDVKENDIIMSSVRLREYINSKMSNAEYTKSIRNMILVKKSFEKHSGVSRPETENLSNTPLTQAIVALAPVMKQFKKINNLDITSLVIVHDGDADNISSYCKSEIALDKYGVFIRKKSQEYIFQSDLNTYLRDKENKIDIKLSMRSSLNESVMQWFKKTTGSKIFGFFLINGGSSLMRSAIYNHYYTDQGKLFSMNRYDRDTLDFYEQIKVLQKQIKTEKFLDCNDPIMDGFYLVSGGQELNVEDEEFEIDGKVTASKLKAAFMKFNKKKVVNRVLVSKFISGIAA